jgi:excisionase family DNA binding protein
MNDKQQKDSIETTEKALLTIAVTADKLSVSAAKVYQMCASGELACVRIGRSVRVPAAALDAFVSAHSA